MDSIALFKKSAQRKNSVLALLAFAVFVFALLSLSIGPYNLSLKEIIAVLFASDAIQESGEDRMQLANLIIWDIRLPRILVAILIGTALSVSGNVFQSCFRNPLVEPYILGVSSGAAFGASLAIVFPAVFFSIPLSAFLFAAITVIITLSLGYIRGQVQTLALILAGIVMGSFFSSLVSILKYISNDAALREIVFWLLGGLYHSSWSEIYLLGPTVILMTIFIWFNGWKLNIISVGDDEAKSLGVNPKTTKLLLICAATLITSLSVAYVGIIAWVGLMVPHAARMLIGPDNRYTIPFSALLGALFLIICDTLARNLIQGEIPIGILTSILGAPYLIFLLRTKLR